MMMMTRSRVKQLLGTTLFGLIIPTILFLNAWPGGPGEMVRKIMYVPQLQPLAPTIEVELGSVFSLSDPSYAHAIRVLNRARSGERVIIVVKENFGGAAVALFELSAAMGKSKATVLVRLERFGLSCGTYILADSDYTFIPYDSLILWHFGTYNGTKITVASTDPVIREAAAELEEFFERYRPWVTDEEYAKIRLGQDVYKTGKETCLATDGRNPPVLFQLSDGCVVKGTRQLEPIGVE